MNEDGIIGRVENRTIVGFRGLQRLYCRVFLDGIFSEHFYSMGHGADLIPFFEMIHFD